MKTRARDDGHAAAVHVRALPRRRKPSLAAQVKPFWIVAILLAGAIGWGGAWLVKAPWFRLGRIAIDVPIGSPVSVDRVRNAGAIPHDANVWLLDTRGLARRVEALPYVDRASVRRGQFPKPFVEIAVTVRRPAACVQAGDTEATIDAASRVLQLGCAADEMIRIDAGTARLPAPGGFVADPAVAGLVADVKLLTDADLGIRSVARDRWGGLDAVDVTGVTLRFGDDADLARKAALIQPVRAGVGTSRPIRAIDVRSPGTPVVEFR